MKAMHPVYGIASLAMALAVAGAIAACNRHGTANGAGNTEAAAPAVIATPPNGGTTVGNTAPTGAVAGAEMDNTARGTTAGDMSTSGAPPAPASSGMPADTTPLRNGDKANDKQDGMEKTKKP